MHSLHKDLRARGVDVAVLADINCVKSEFQEYEGVPIWGTPFPVLTSHPFRPGNLKFFLAWQRIKRTVRGIMPKPDLIQVTTFRQPALIGYWLANSLNVPLVIRLACSGQHGDFRFFGENWLCRRELPKIVKSVSRVIALDQNTKAESLSSGVPEHAVRIISNGLVLKSVPDLTTKRPSPDGGAIVFVGRLAHQKRVDTLLEAFARLRQHHPKLPALTLTIAGDGDQRPALEEFCRRMGTTEACKFLGAVPSPEDVLSSACCFVNPSVSEGLPNAVLEAVAFGVPIILSDIPVHRDIALATGMERFLFPVGDAEALANRILAFLEDREECLQSYLPRCIGYRAAFSPEVRTNAYLGLYQEVLAHGGSLP